MATVLDQFLFSSALGAVSPGSYLAGLRSAPPLLIVGNGAPNAAPLLAAPQGAIYIQLDAGDSGAIWQKTGGGSTPTTTGWTLGGGAPIQKTFTLTNAQVQSLNSVPVQIVAAPGAGLIALPLQWALDYSIPTSAMSANPIIGIRYAGDATVLAGNSVTLNSAGTTRLQTTRIADGAVITGVRTTYANKALNLVSSVDVTGGDAANIFSVSVWYLLMPAAA